MSDTFRAAWQVAGLHCPLADPVLLRTWAQWAYNRACQRRNWSHLRTESLINVNDQKTGTVGVTVDSATVAGNGMVFAATDAGRQFRLASALPIYSILTVSLAGATSCTIDQVFTGTTDPAASAVILDAYVTMPENFQQFLAVVDPVNKWRLRWGITEDEINRWDPGRQSSISPRCLVSQRYNVADTSNVTTAPRARYEMWPYGTTKRSYPLLYKRKPEILDEESIFVGPFARRGFDIFLEGMLCRAALWPGLNGTDKKNPYFNLNLSANHEARFYDMLDELATDDEDLYPTWKVLVDYPLAQVPWDSNWMQSHDVSLGDVYL